jgi:hypothetical protein
MATSALVDAGFLVAILSRRDGNHGWAAEQASRFPPPWMTLRQSYPRLFTFSEDAEAQASQYCFVAAFSFAATGLPPELTRGINIKINRQISLRAIRVRYSCRAGQSPQASGRFTAKSSCNYIVLAELFWQLREIASIPTGYFVIWDLDQCGRRDSSFG